MSSSSKTPRLSPHLLGERVRELRGSAGLTQSELAGTRFSKEYISQIERGKTRPTPATVEWLAERLNVDSAVLAGGISADDRARGEALLARADGLASRRDFAAAVAEYRRATPHVQKALPLLVRALSGEGWARAQGGKTAEGLELLARARQLVEDSGFSDAERAEVVFRLGACRYLAHSIATATALFDEALRLAGRSSLPTDGLRVSILTWRSRCYRRQRDYVAAREDVGSALELAESLSDPRAVAEASFQASAVAERSGNWLLAREYAERARVAYDELADRQNVGRLLNNLGGIDVLLGDPELAIGHFKESFAIALEVDSDAEAATAVSSLAQVQLLTGDAVAAEEHARHALTLLVGRDDRLDEVGNAQLVLGRALLEQERPVEAAAELHRADEAFERLDSVSHRAAVWVAQGDLARSEGDLSAAAELYRLAADALQDFRF